jgi:hypothetical protein
MMFRGARQHRSPAPLHSPAGPNHRPAGGKRNALARKIEAQNRVFDLETPKVLRFYTAKRNTPENWGMTSAQERKPMSFIRDASTDR